VTAPKKRGQKICASQVACDGSFVNSEQFDSCFRCRERQAQRSKPPSPLRGEHVLRYQESRYK